MEGSSRVVVEETSTIFQPLVILLELVSRYGWVVLGAGGALVYLWGAWLTPWVRAWRERREEAQHHKDPDRALSRLAAVRAARDRQQRELEERSRGAKEEREERRERERGARAPPEGGQRGDGYLPLSGGGAHSSYRAPKRSACSGGGCGR